VEKCGLVLSFFVQNKIFKIIQAEIDCCLPHLTKRKSKKGGKLERERERKGGKLEREIDRADIVY